MQHLGTKSLETKRLLLRAYTAEDAETVFANWATDAPAARFWSWQVHKNIEETRRLIEGWIAEYVNPTYYHWAIIDRENGQAIGYIYLDSVDSEKKRAAVHYLLGSAYWNRGLMTEACTRVLRFALEEVGFESIASWHHKDNAASGKVLQKCGMVFQKEEYQTQECERLSGIYCYYVKKKPAADK